MTNFCLASVLRSLDLAASHISSDANGPCISCTSSTKYTCLKCRKFICTRCSIFEDDEENVGWKAERAVSRCDACFREKIGSEEVDQEIGRSSSSRASIRSFRLSSCESTEGEVMGPTERYVCKL